MRETISGKYYFAILCMYAKTRQFIMFWNSRQIEKAAFTTLQV